MGWLVQNYWSNVSYTGRVVDKGGGELAKFAQCWQWEGGALLPNGSPWGPFSDFGSPKGPHFFEGHHYLPFQAEECAKSQSSHYLLNFDHLNTCDDKTSLFNENGTNLCIK